MAGRVGEKGSCCCRALADSARRGGGAQGKGSLHMLTAPSLQPTLTWTTCASCCSGVISSVESENGFLGQAHCLCVTGKTACQVRDAPSRYAPGQRKLVWETWLLWACVHGEGPAYQKGARACTAAQAPLGHGVCCKPSPAHPPQKAKGSTSCPLPWSVLLTRPVSALSPKGTIAAARTGVQLLATLLSAQSPWAFVSLLIRHL